MVVGEVNVVWINDKRFRKLKGCQLPREAVAKYPATDAGRTSGGSKLTQSQCISRPAASVECGLASDSGSLVQQEILAGRGSVSDLTIRLLPRNSEWRPALKEV